MRIAGAVACFALATSCSRTVYEAHFASPAQLSKITEAASRSPFIKCHMADGRVIVLEHWAIEEGTGIVDGFGIEYDADRHARSVAQHQQLALADVVLIETNRPYDVDIGTGSIVAMAIGTGVSLAVTAICLAPTGGNSVNKACFGSCPTFFADDGRAMALQAEGFSSSIARSLEATDVDAMWTARPKSRDFDVVMTNDALETHVVDSVRVLAATRPAGGRVLRAGGKYYGVANMRAPAYAVGGGRDVTELFAASDEREYKSLASATNLADRETVDVRFDVSTATGKAKRLGLLVVDRNSLLNTFLFYQALAFMGSRVGDWMTAIEKSGRETLGSVATMLGNIEVLAKDATGAFVHAGEVGEVGPIAREAELVVLPDGIVSLSAGHVDVRLSMVKGNWKIDQLALVDVGDALEPVALEPLWVTRDGKVDERALGALLDSKRHLVTQPGDAYTIHFRLPAGDQELFLESRGYYYEWMREEWLKEEDQLAALQLVMNPSAALKKLAPRFKAIEPDMDRIFWQSRVTR